MSERIAVVDLGSNSTRLLIADVDDDGSLVERERRSTVTRLGQGVDAAGRLADDAIERVYAVLTDYRAAIDEHGAPPAIGVLTSAVRDASNGAEFTRTVRERFGIDAHTIPGDEEARLTYLGATSDRPGREPTAVIDVGGGSTEVVCGAGGELGFHVSTQVGVVRHTERHLHTDPPTAPELAALRADAARTFAEQVPPDLHMEAGIAVAGTATQSAAILGVRRLERDALQTLLDRLAALPLTERREVPGLDPERAPTIVAGVAILLEAMTAVGLDGVGVSDRDVLHGAALERTAFRSSRHPQF